MLLPPPLPEETRPEPPERPYREPMARWKFALLLVAFCTWFNLAIGLGGWWSATLIGGFLVWICLAAVRYGAESRDGKDWKPAFSYLPDRHATKGPGRAPSTYL